MTTKTRLATIHMDKEHHDAMVKLQTWLNAMPEWFELSEWQHDQIAEVEQDAIEASSCTKKLREDCFTGFDLNDDGALIATFHVTEELSVLVLPR